MQGVIETTGGKMTIVVAGENRLARDSLVANIDSVFGVDVLYVCNLTDIIELADRIGNESLLLLDYDLALQSQGLEELRNRLCGRPRVAVYSAPGAPDEAMRWLNLGYDGYLPRTMSASAIVCAVQLMVRGERFVPSITINGSRPVAETKSINAALSPRQNEILAMVATGASNKHIARALSVEEVTVKSHVKAIFRKLGVHSRTEAARYVLAGPIRPWAAVGELS
jgi:DNA-binding NarL/FixJ family response regulator